MKNKIFKALTVAAIVGVSLLPLQSANAWPWGFNCCGISVGQSWGWGGPWGYPGWGYPGWGYPGWGYPRWGYPGWGYPGWGPWGHPGYYPLLVIPTTPTTPAKK